MVERSPEEAGVVSSILTPGMCRELAIIFRILPKDPIEPQFKQIALWPEYESFRAAALLFFLGENVVLAVANLGLYWNWLPAQVIAVLGILLAIVASYQAVVFVDRTKSHFVSQPKVMEAIAHSDTKLTKPNHWARFFRTLDGQLFLLTLAQLVLVIGQLWFALH